MRFQKARCAVVDWLIHLLCPGMFFYDPGRNPFYEIDKDEGVPLGSAAATTLVSCCVDSGKTELQATFQGFERKLKPCGDWVVIVRRVNASKEE